MPVEDSDQSACPCSPVRVFVCVEVLRPSQPNGVMSSAVSLFVCVEVLRPSQPNRVMSSAVSLPNHTFTGQA